MPNKGGKKKGKRNTGQTPVKRTLVYKGDMEEYAQITKMLGDRKIMVMLPDKSEMLAVIPGRFRKRCWMKVGDILIISRREFQATKLDVIYKYNDEETRKLAKDHEIPDFFLQAFVGGVDGEYEDDDDNLVWDDEYEANDNSQDEEHPIKQKMSYEEINNMIDDI